MIYRENHTFFKRTAELLDTHIHVFGGGMFYSAYDMKFPYSDLSPEPRKIKIPSRFRMLPIAFATGVSGFLLILSMYFSDLITDYPGMIFSFSYGCIVLCHLIAILHSLLVVDLC
jgi:hypothetical protein